MTLRQALWFSQMGCETIFIVDLTIPTHQWSIFWDSWGLFQTLSVDWELWWHATLGHISPLSYLFSLAFNATIFSHFDIQSYQFIIWHSEPPSLLSYGVQSHHLFSITTFKVVLLNFGIQSHHIFSVWCSKPLPLLSFGVQSHHPFSIMAFRATIPA